MYGLLVMKYYMNEYVDSKRKINNIRNDMNSLLEQHEKLDEKLSQMKLKKSIPRKSLTFHEYYRCSSRQAGASSAGPIGQAGASSAGLTRYFEASDTASEEFDTPSSDGTPPIQLSSMGTSGGTSRDDTSSGGTCSDRVDAEIINVTEGAASDKSIQFIGDNMNNMKSKLHLLSDKMTMVTCSITDASELVAERTSRAREEVVEEAKIQAKLNWKEKFTLFLREEAKLPLSVMLLVMFLSIACYTLLGAWLFTNLEGPHETKEKIEIEIERTSLLEVLFNETFVIDNATDWFAAADSRIKEYETKLYQSFQHGVSPDTDVRVWTFVKALFFVSTITTTIGYGHIAPVTTEGRILTIIYAIIGIPLMLALLTDLGKLFTRIWEYIFECFDRFNRSERCKIFKRSCPVQHCTACFRFIFFCCGRKRNTERSPDCGSEQPLQNERTKTPEVTEAQDVLETKEQPIVEGEFQLPIFLALFILAIYIIIGCGIFTLWENWSFGEAFYFIFISISTIGFGDLVPEHPGFMMASSFYMMFGLAITTMTIASIQTKLSIMFANVTIKMKDQLIIMIHDAQKAAAKETETEEEEDQSEAKDKKSKAKGKRFLLGSTKTKES